MIDICDFAVDVAAALRLTIAANARASDDRAMAPPRPGAGDQRVQLPVAVWAWNAALALVCGNPVIWKPSEKAPLTAAATNALAMRALAKFGDAPEGLLHLVRRPRCRRATGRRFADCPGLSDRSTAMGRSVGPRVANRFGRVLLELGGNNAMIVTPSADLDLAERAILFSAAGTAGQRCTTLRRLIVHESIADELVERLRGLFDRVAVGDPRDAGTLIGPLIDVGAFEAMSKVGRGH